MLEPEDPATLLWRMLLYDFASGLTVEELAEAHQMTERQAEAELRASLNWAEARKWRRIAIEDLPADGELV
jgi:hypothetical protein